MGFGTYFRGGNGYSRVSNNKDTGLRLKKLETAVEELQTRYSTIMNTLVGNNKATSQKVSNNKRPSNKGSKSNAELLQVAKNYYHGSGTQANLNKHNLKLNVGMYGAYVNVLHKGRKIGNIGSGSTYH
jgi:hypothetical protein